MNTALRSLKRALHIFMQTSHGATVGNLTRHTVEITTTTREGAVMVTVLKYNTNRS